jgi:predicted nucleic acid-binding protein
MAIPKKVRNDFLIFVDTNIFLDFYRERKSDVSLRFLEQLESMTDRLIIGSQVEMEYKKHRQEVILESLGKFGAPDWNKLSTPAILAKSQSVEIIYKSKQAIASQQKKISSKIRMIMENPVHNDIVYQSLQRIFKAETDINLNRKNKKRFEIRELAKKRFFLGYPPRKQGDTSIGDAINWEWIIECAIQRNTNTIIVSRDGDYGVNYDDKWYINDWLSQEYRQRVNPKKKVLLTGKLSEALKVLNVAVSKKMENAEDEMLNSQKQVTMEKACDPSASQQ